uniref:UV-stimulated scaffold protein A n=1 Tax=Panagrolaimus sp. JU765 TaxID=591449 RepID=A0AC34RH53_9BILA
MDIADVKFCVRTIINKFDYEKRDLEQRSLTRLKSIIKAKTDLIPEFEKYLMENLTSQDSDKRLCIVLISDYFFQRSHAFRTVLLDDLQEFLTYTMELDPLYYPLPGPTKAAILLKKETQNVFKLWDGKFADGYPKLRRTMTMLMKSKKFNFDRVDGLTAVERTRQDAERKRIEIVNKRIQDEIYKEFVDSRVHFEEALMEAKTTLDLLFPDFRQETEMETKTNGVVTDMPEKVFVSIPNSGMMMVEKSDDNMVLLNALNDSKKILASNSKKLKEWLEKLSKHEGSGETFEAMTKLQREMTNEFRRCKELKVVEKRKALLNKKTIISEEEDSDDDDGFETVDLSVKDPEGFANEFSEKAEEVLIPELSSVPDEEPQPVKKPPKKKTRDEPVDCEPGPSFKKTISAPVLSFGLDLKYWGQDVVPADLVDNSRLDGLNFWRPPDHERIGQESEDAYKTRLITFVGEMPEITRSCRAPLPSGKLCPRMDRKTCPLHGPIIDRDEQGNPVNQLADWGQTPLQRQHEEFVQKQKDAEEDAFLKQLEIQTEGKFSYDLAKRVAKRKEQRKKRQKAPGEA